MKLKISKIYHKYKISPNLQTHQFRVAAVAKLIAINSKLQVDTENIVTACLLHDMGNIIKFNLDYNPEALGPEGIEYWQKVKDGFISKYGHDEHHATSMIMKEIGVSEIVLDYFSNMGFSNGKETSQCGDLNKLIAAYSDHRVAPSGILSLDERVREGMARFKKNKPEFATKETDEQTTKLLGYFHKIENEIFKNSKIKPEDITDESIKPLMDDLIMKDDLVI